MTTTIKYVGTRFERIVKDGAPIENVHYIDAGGRVAMIKTFSDATPDETRYFHKDHLGSIDTITDENGNIAERLAYDAWGKRRNTGWSDAPVTIVALETPRGFTGHEHLDDIGLIHMNGRVYDPLLGRFLSADPFVQFPHSTQGLNRYTYANNNPLSFTDPSGFFFKSLFKRIGRVFKKVGKSVKKYIKPIAAIGIASIRKLPRQVDILKVEIPAFRVAYSAGGRPASESCGRTSLYSMSHLAVMSRTSVSVRNR